MKYSIVLVSLLLMHSSDVFGFCPNPDGNDPLSGDFPTLLEDADSHRELDGLVVALSEPEFFRILGEESNVFPPNVVGFDPRTPGRFTS